VNLTTAILIISLFFIVWCTVLISALTWWRWKEKNLNQRLEEVILTVPKIKDTPLKVIDIEGEVISGSILEEEEIEGDEETVEVREWRNEQNWLNRRKQAES
jgi:hypothetical protein